jgi:serine/threonine protein kinase
MPNVTVGSLIDHYKILDEIGKGGMGVVFKALNVNLDKLVAVKTIALGLASDEIFLNRFRTEARALARLQDPNIVNIYDLRLDDNQWFIVMEYVEGSTLAKRIREGSAIPWREALNIFKQMLSAIGHAHRLGIIHRDIKPNNVMITRDGIVKVTDFGLAKDQRNHNQTMVSSTGGTLYYMSPEQIKGLHYTDFRSDIYALGLTFYEMLTGKIPFRKNDTDFTIREAIIRREFPPPTHFNSEIPLCLNNLVMRAVEKKPEDRFQSIDSMFEAINEFEKESGLAPGTEESVDEKKDISAAPEPAYDISLFSDTVPQQVIPDPPMIKKRKFRSFGRIAIAFSVFFIALAIIYFFPETSSKQPVMIVSQPDQAQVYLNNDLLGITPFYSDNIGYSSFSLNIRKNDYISIDTLVKIRNDSLKYLTFQLTPLSRLTIDFYPDDSKIFVDDKKYDLKPSEEITLPAGDYRLRIAHAGYLNFEQNISLKPGTNPRINATLIKETNASQFSLASVMINSTPSEENINIQLPRIFANLSVESTPPDASVWIDDKLISGNNTPLKIDSLALGTHLVRIEKEGYRTYKTEIVLKDQPENNIFTDLIVSQGNLNISIQPWGSIYIDGQLKKKDTNIKYSSVLPAGEHTVKVVHPLYGDWEKVFHVRDGETINIPVNFNNLVNLSVTAFDADGMPIWAEIVVDNKVTGELTPKEISVRVGQRIIAAKKDGYILVSGECKLMLDNNFDEPIKFIFKKVL